MAEPVHVLIIVEGGKAEPQFFNRIASAFSLHFSICCLGTNIYSLYKKMKELDFNADIRKVFADLHPEYGEILSQKFAYTYLVFDLDPHHTKKDDNRTLEDIIQANLEKIREMAAFFTDETDPTVGRLYINYPMLESFRDCDAPFDPHYQNEFVFLRDIIHFKSYVAGKKMAGKHYDKYSADDYQSLIRMNVYKLHLLHRNKWEPMSYAAYRDYSQIQTILNDQTTCIATKNNIAVLNTSLFLLLDYYGNQNGFFDAVIKIGTSQSSGQ